MRLLLYVILLVTLIIGCKKHTVNSSINQSINIKLVDSLINQDLCSINHINNQINIKIESYDKTLNIKQLNFIMNQLSDVEIDCLNKVIIIRYYESIGNQHIQTVHVLEKKEGKLFFKKIYRFESNRNEVNLYGAILVHQVNDYIGVEPNVIMTDIYNFNGFQQELIPTIDKYYDSITLLFKDKNYEKLSLWTNSVVISHIVNIVEINKFNISKYNDIAYYLEQSGAYIEAIFLLEKIIKQSPNRTVAYINLGDAYWGNNEQEKAKNAYNEYLELMKVNGKEHKIPERVFNRL